MDDRQFFDQLAPTWDANEVKSTPEKVNEILDIIGIEKGEAVLDLGTGTGVLLPYIAKRIGEAGKILAVDYSEGMLARAREKYEKLIPNAMFLNLDFENENLEGEFDKIIMYCVYPHLHNPVDTLKWLRKVNLKEGGGIYIAFPCGEDFINNIHKEKHSESDLLPSAEKLAAFFRENGLNAEVLVSNEGAYVVRIT